MTGHGVRSEGHTAQRNTNCGMRVTLASHLIIHFRKSSKKVRRVRSTPAHVCKLGCDGDEVTLLPYISTSRRR